MPEDKYNSGGFKQTGDGAIFPDLSDDPADYKDYQFWDWKQIEAAILGSTQGNGSQQNQDAAHGIADPESLQNAAETFYFVQRTLEQIAQILADQTKALAGPDGPWRGDAADVFYDTLTNYSKRISAAADALAGGKTGDNSVPKQLANNAEAFKWAQKTILDIDSWYAGMSAQYGEWHGEMVSQMKDGRIPIGDVTVGGQLIEPMMTQDMYQVADQLSQNFILTIDNIKFPEEINNPKPDPGSGDPQPKVEPPPTGNDDVKVPSLGGGGGLGTGGGLGGGVPSFGGNLSAIPGLGDTGGGTATPFPGSTLAAGSGGGLGDVPPFDAGNLDAALNPGGTGGLGATVPPFPGDTTLPGGDTSAFPGGGLPGNLAVTPFPGDTGTLPADAALPVDTGALPADGVAFPGSTSLGGGLQTPSTFAVTPFPGLTSLPTGASTASTGSGGLGNAAESPFGEAGLPQDYPGDLGLPGTAAGLGTADLPADTTLPSTLPGNVALESPGTLPGTTPAEFPGLGDALAGADHQQGGAGMPYLPGMGAGAAGGAGAGHGAVAEPPDAAGLLDASSVPWDEHAGGVGDVSEFGGAGAAPGAVADASGLDLPETTPAEFAGAEGPGGQMAAVAGAGMPYLPGMGAGAAGGAGTGQGGVAEPPDSAGLLESDQGPWDDGEHAADPAEPAAGAVAAAGAGAVALDLPAGEAAGGPSAPVADGELSAVSGAAMLWAASLGAPGATGGDLPRTGAARNGHTGEGRREFGDGDGHGVPGAVAGPSWTEPAGAAGPGAAVVAGPAPDAPAAGPAQGPGAAFGTEATTAPNAAPGRTGAVAAMLGTAALAAEAVLIAGGSRGAAGAEEPTTAPDGTEESEDTAAWDRTDGPLLPFLNAAATAEEPARTWDGPRSRYSGEAAGTWSDETGATAATPAASALVTWQPERSGAATPSSGLVQPGNAQSRCGDLSAEEAEALIAAMASEKEAQEAAEDEEEQKERSFADLLVQRQDAWGVPGDDDVLG